MQTRLLPNSCYKASWFNPEFQVFFISFDLKDDNVCLPRQGLTHLTTVSMQWYDQSSCFTSQYQRHCISNNKLSLLWTLISTCTINTTSHI